MYKLITANGETSYGINEYVVDTPEDIESLPRCDMGSIAFVISTATVYMKNSEGNWVEI